VDYPDAERAAAGHAALRAGQIGDVVTSDTSNTLLGVVFGEVDRAEADALLTEALQ
jgi:diphthamide biosynthesis methyltransferase